MPQLRIGLAQVDSIVGDLAGNTDVVCRWTAHAVEQG
jgi:NAD+ synthase (glutamine-hydrolysing)